MLTLNLLTGLIALPLLLCFALGAVYFYFQIAKEIQNLKDQSARREIALTHWKYDQNGNPEFYYNPTTGDYFIPGNGNPLNPPQNIFINGVQQQIKAKEKTPAKWFHGSEFKAELDLSEKEPEQIEAPEQTEQGERVLSSLEEIGDFLIAEKQKGTDKTKALLAIGVKSGSSRAYKTWSPFWDNIAVTKHVAPYLNQSLREGKES